MTSPSEVIAIEGAGGSEQFKFKHNIKQKKRPKNYPYFVDPSIVPRVKQYLEDNRDKVYVDIDEMVTELQRKYRDYAKRKRAAFKGLVEKAFSVVLKTYSINDNDTPRDVSDSSDVSDMDVDSGDVDLIVDSNVGNNQVLNMYMQHQALKKLTCPNAGKVNDGANELIDISSDDDEEETPAKRTKHADSTNCSEPKISQPLISHTPSPKENGQASHNEDAIAEEDSTVSNQPTATAVPSPAITPARPGRPKRKRPTGDEVSNPSATSGSDDAPRKRRRDFPVVKPSCSFKDVGGCSSVLQEVCKLLLHLRHPQIYEQIGLSPPRGFLLHGPPGCGKSLLANAIAGELKVPLLKVSAPELIAGVSGESEERIRDLFDQAVSLAPCVLFLDEIDAITPNRNNAQREMERRIVAQLLTSLDGLGEKEGGNQVLVVGATNRPDSLDSALRRAGRFDQEICMGIPDRESRAHILRVVCGRLTLDPDVSSDAGIEELASLTPGFVGADLAALTREAAMVAVNRIFAQLQEKEKEHASKLAPEQKGVVNENGTQNLSGKHIGNVQEETSTETEEAMESTGKQISLSSESKFDQAPASKEVIELEKTDEQDVDIVPSATNVVASNEHTVEVENTQATDKLVNENEDIQEVTLENESKHQGESTISTEQNPSDSAMNIEVIPPTEKINATTDAHNDQKNKTDDDIEVLEVNAAICQKDMSESLENEPATEEGEQKDLALSQKLLPSAIWSPELCQLMSWLKDVPPLTQAQLSGLTITMSDFHEALRHVQPSSKREGFATVPDVTWEDVGSLANVRAELQLSVLGPVRYPKQYAQLGLTAPAGVLLCGPPGCGKTLLAKAVANEAGVNFISVKGPELLNMYVGESERAVRQVFQRARNSAPCVIFFDELDALCPRRSDSGDNGVSSRVVNQLLTEMDGVEGRAAVYLMAASNRPDIIDPAVLRPGRLDKIVYVGLPNAEDRVDILRALTKGGLRPQLAADVNLAEIALRPQLDGYSGADLAALVREAGVQALQEFICAGEASQTSSLSVAMKHFNSAVFKIRPSVTLKARKHYEKLQEMYGSSPLEGKSESTPADKSGPTPADKSGSTPADKSGPTPVENSGPTPAENSGPTPVENSGPTPAENSGSTHAEKSGSTPSEKSGSTPSEKSGSTPADKSESAERSVCSSGEKLDSGPGEKFQLVPEDAMDTA